MLRELISSISTMKWTCAPGSRSLWAYQPERISRHPEAMTGQSPEHPLEQSAPHAHPYTARMIELEEKKEKEFSDCPGGHSLFQELFFFCTIKNVGDVQGPGCIYVETVVDRDCGIAFAKVYPSKNAMNAVDILASRVAPFFRRRGAAIKEIYTRKTSEYYGLSPVHPFETYLATSHIQHLPMEQPGQPSNYLCEQFYRFLLKEFFLPALRRKFQFSLDDLQKGLDIFVESYNAMQMKRVNQGKNTPPPSVNFPVDL